MQDVTLRVLMSCNSSGMAERLGMSDKLLVVGNGGHLRLWSEHVFRQNLQSLWQNPI